MVSTSSTSKRQKDAVSVTLPGSGSQSLRWQWLEVSWRRCLGTRTSRRLALSSWMSCPREVSTRVIMGEFVVESGHPTSVARLAHDAGAMRSAGYGCAAGLHARDAPLPPLRELRARSRSAALRPCARKPAGSAWRELSTPHFRVKTDLSEALAREAVTGFETDYAELAATAFRGIDVARPFDVVLLQSEGEFHDWASSIFAGVYSNQSPARRRADPDHHDVCGRRRRRASRGTRDVPSRAHPQVHLRVPTSPSRRGSTKGSPRRRTTSSMTETQGRRELRATCRSRCDS